MAQVTTLLTIPIGQKKQKKNNLNNKFEKIMPNFLSNILLIEAQWTLINRIKIYVNI